MPGSELDPVETSTSLQSQSFLSREETDDK